MSASHTPGPWEINEGDGMAIAKVSLFAITAPCTAEVGSGLSKEENLANARLIAAAPDLLVACQRLISFCSHRDGTLGSFDHWITTFVEDGSTLTECVTLARAAIAKAEGRPAEGV
jgi:hypothetical protein